MKHSTLNITDFTPPAATSDSLIDAPYLRAVAELAQTRGNVRFTPGGGILFHTPISRDERRALPEPQNIPPRYIDLPMDRFNRVVAAKSAFGDLVAKYTVPHLRDGYKLVVIPLSGPLSASQLRTIANCAETFGHGTLRLTADVSIRLPNVPAALLRPLFRLLEASGLVSARVFKQAA